MTERPVAIRVADLRKSFATHEVLKGVSLKAREGDVVAIIGGSGSGKSTMLRCINFLETPSVGRIEIGGEAVAMRPDGSPSDRRQIERLRQSLGMVFQNFNLWTHKTVLENLVEVPVHVLRPPKSEAEERARRLLARVGLAEKAGAYPAFMSGGQQQRVAIIRCVAMEPEVLLLDEVTSALDPELVGEVLEILKDLALGGMMILLATHEMRFARDVASSVVFLHQGQLIEKGPPGQIFEAPQMEETRKFLRRALEG